MLYVPDIVLDIRDTTEKMQREFIPKSNLLFAFLKDHLRGPFLASLSSLIPFHLSAVQSPSAVILEPRKIKSATVSTVSPPICYEVMGPDAMILVF